MSDPIVVERVITAPPSVVYAYLTDPQKWARWQGVNAGIEARVGGELRISMPNGATASGWFVELVPDRRAVFTWGWVGHAGVPPGSSTVEIELLEEGSGTLLRLTHSGLPAGEVSIHREGWDRYVPRLVEVAEGGEPEPDTAS